MTRRALDASTPHPGGRPTVTSSTTQMPTLGSTSIGVARCGARTSTRRRPPPQSRWSRTGVVGFAAVQATPEPDAGRPEELTMLYVLARAHGGGAGQALLDATLGGRPASLWVAADNPRAHSFYRRNGFTPDGSTSSFGPIETTVRLVR
ncbi:GNAT family N-acetyltransferase [Curtobacterium sp. VKM Ac-2884]|uniref:GNAT family N-acetyltransferase n=1 Tax=Curtobacterium sp. VKM Ac-2884 TaxID=2783818 RepID=UPI003A5C839A